MSVVPWQRLPDELWQRVLRRLDAPALGAWRGACKRARQQANAATAKVTVDTDAKYLAFGAIASAFPGLRHVCLHGAGEHPTDADVAHVVLRCPRLHKLHVDGEDAPITAHCLLPLMGSPELATLDLTSLEVDTSQTLRLPRLRRLILTGCAGWPLGWLTPAALPQLRDLELADSDVDAADLGALTQLTALTVAGEYDDAQALAAAAGQLTGLRSLKFAGVAEPDVRALAALTALTVCRRAAGLEHLTGLRRLALRWHAPDWARLPDGLEDLECAALQLPPAACQRLSALPRLQHLSLQNCTFQAVDLAHLFHAPALRVLTWVPCPPPESSMVFSLNKFLAARGGRLANAL